MDLPIFIGKISLVFVAKILDLNAMLAILLKYAIIKLSRAIPPDPAGWMPEHIKEVQYEKFTHCFLFSNYVNFTICL